MTPRTTQAFLLCVTAAVVGYTLYAYLFVGEDVTVSQTTLRAATTWPIIPFLFGVVCGHVFWPAPPPGSETTLFWVPVVAWAVVLAGTVTAVVAVDDGRKARAVMCAYPVIPLLVGLVMGRVMWGQAPPLY